MLDLILDIILVLAATIITLAYGIPGSSDYSEKASEACQTVPDLNSVVESSKTP
jgi:hypothetical protein